MADGKDCKCWAHGECECGCGADWTPQEIYDLRSKLKEAEEKISARDGYIGNLESHLKTTEQRLFQAEAEKDDAERRWSEIADSLQKKISVYEAQEKAWLSRIVVGDMDACGALIDALKIQGTKLKEAEAEIRRIKNG